MCNTWARADDHPGVAGIQRPETREKPMNKMMIRLSTLIRQQADADDRGGVAADGGGQHQWEKFLETWTHQGPLSSF